MVRVGTDRAGVAKPIEGFGEIAGFGGRVVGDVLRGRVLRFFGEALRQAGILILGSTLVIWGLVFIIGLQCGIEGAYFTRAQGTCLLYTSPSPRDLSTSRMPSSA